MRTLRLAFICMVFMLSFGICAQNKEIKDVERQDLFTSKERDSLQFWFYDRATVMGLQGDKRDEFYNIVIYHTFKMKNLNKPEKGFSDDEVRTKVQELLRKQHQEVRAMLNDKQYTYYVETMTKIMDEVFARRGWN